MLSARSGLRPLIRASLVVLGVATFTPAVALAGRHGDHGNGHGNAPPAKTVTVHGSQTSQGVVQSVTPRAVVLTLLDGSSVAVPVDRRTHVLLDGVPATLAQVRPGYIATATVKDGQPTAELQVVNPQAQAQPNAVTGLATVQSVSPTLVVVTASDGSTVSIHVRPGTRIFVNGKRASLRDVKPGFTTVLPAGGAKGTRHPGQLRFLQP